jgi:uncharacterized protein (TIGR03790 family)
MEFPMLRAAALQALFLSFVFGASALTPDEILVVANSRVPEGVDVAKQYCAKRHVPESQLIILSLPTTETLSRQSYDNDLAGPLRSSLEAKPDLKSRIKCLLTVYGVPLVAGGHVSTSEEQAAGKKLTAMFNKTRISLCQQLGTLCEFARTIDIVPPSTLADLTPDKLSADKLPGQMAAARNLLAGVDKKINALPAYRRHDEKAAKFDEIRQRLAGHVKAGDGNGPQENLQQAADGPSEYAKAAVGSEGREKLYQAREKSGGLLGLCEQLLMDTARLEQRESEASVDSELSLLYWGNYELYRWQPNMLNPAIASKLKPPLPPMTLMVARLDGPTPAIAAALVDRALQGESEGLKGTFYIDASAAQRGRGGLYKLYDESLEKLAGGLKEHTTAMVVLNTSAELFKPGECPDAAMYCGWYSPSKYIDSFSWAPGAVGYHITSFGAQGLHKQDSVNWCKCMLEKGIAATLGPVSEPYLHSFPPPEDFFRVFLSGRMSLVESYYRTNPFTSWRMILLGDPLYNPFRTHPVAEPSSKPAEKTGK